VLLILAPLYARYASQSTIHDTQFGKVQKENQDIVEILAIGQKEPKNVVRTQDEVQATEFIVTKV
jgi:hypothetical protein